MKIQNSRGVPRSLGDQIEMSCLNKKAKYELQDPAHQSKESDGLPDLAIKPNPEGTNHRTPYPFTNMKIGETAVMRATHHREMLPMMSPFSCTNDSI